MSIKPVLVPDQDAKTLRALLESFDAAASGPTKKQLTESVEQGVAEGSENFTITHQKDRSFPGSTQVVVTDKNTGKQKVIAGDPKKIRQQLKHEFGIDYNFEQQGVAEGFPYDVDHMPGPVIRDADMTSDNVKTRDKAYWDRAVDSINARVFDDMAEFRTDSRGESVTGNSAVWAKWDAATETGWFNHKGRPLKIQSVKEQGVAEARDRISVEHRGDGYKVYFSQNKGAYTARGEGGYANQIQPEWFHTLADAIEHAEMELHGMDEARDDDDDIWTSNKDGSPKGLPQGRRGQTGREQSYDWSKKYDDYAPDDEGDDWYDDLDETIDSEEYNDEAGMAHSNLITIARAAEGLLDTIDDNENLPEWAQEKIAKVEGMLVAVWDYLESQEQQGIDPEIESESFYESAAWKRKEGKNKNGGLNAKGVASYRREHPGSKLQTAVTTKPSKLKPGSKAAKRRKSFCARMSGVKGPMKKPNGDPTRKALALRKWNCESVEQSVAMLESVGQNLKELKQRLDPKCWKGKHKEGTKIKGGVRVNNCVPNESINEAEVQWRPLETAWYKNDHGQWIDVEISRVNPDGTITVSGPGGIFKVGAKRLQKEKPAGVMESVDPVSRLKQLLG